MTADPDVRRIYAAQAARAAAYGFAAVLLGTVLEARGWSTGRIGMVLAAILAGTVTTSALVGAFGDRWGRRRCYAVLFVGLGAAGLAFAATEEFWFLVAAALAGTLSTEVVENGPFTSLEQAMLATVPAGGRTARRFGTYNAIAALAGAAGAVAAGLPEWAQRHLTAAPAPHRWFSLLAVAALLGLVASRGLSSAVEAPPRPPESSPRRALDRSRPDVLRLTALFAVDSFAGGFVVQTFLAFYLAERYGASTGAIGLLFGALGLLGAASFLVAPRIAERIGLLPTMVATHIPSSGFLVAAAFAPSFGVAVACLAARAALSQMDVPTRQAYVMALVDPAERVAAAATTNTGRYLTRPLGPVLGAGAAGLAIGLPLVIAGGLKIAYDLALWAWFRSVPLAVDDPVPTAPGPAGTTGT